MKSGNGVKNWCCQSGKVRETAVDGCCPVVSKELGCSTVCRPAAVKLWSPKVLCVRRTTCLGCWAESDCCTLSCVSDGLSSFHNTNQVHISLVKIVYHHHHHHHHHHHADIYNAPVTTKQEHMCSTKIHIVVDETYWTLKAILKR